MKNPEEEYEVLQGLLEALQKVLERLIQQENRQQEINRQNDNASKQMTKSSLQIEQLTLELQELKKKNELENKSRSEKIIEVEALAVKNLQILAEKPIIHKKVYQTNWAMWVICGFLAVLSVVLSFSVYRAYQDGRGDFKSYIEANYIFFDKSNFTLMEGKNGKYILTPKK
jgi:hypothetical protein